MLRFRQIKSAAAAYHYFEKSDSGLAAQELHKEVGGHGAALLGLSKEPDFEQFKRLLHGLDPHTGEPLSEGLKKNVTKSKSRTPGWDLTASLPKGVTVAIESGDKRVHDLLWQAWRFAMNDVSQHLNARVGGERYRPNTTIYYGFEHPDTRPSRQDNMPDPDRHIHGVLMNLMERDGKWYAIDMEPTWKIRKYFDRRFDMYLARGLTELGYEVQTKYKQGKYYSWDIKGIPESVIKKFSRRSQEVEKLAEDLGVVSPMGKDKLGATSRLHKRKDLTLDDYREYWSSRLTKAEKKQMVAAVAVAKAGKNPKPQNTIDKAVEYAIGHEFYRNSVVDLTDLEISAMERSMGGAHPEEVLPELRKQGVLIKDGEATTRKVLDQEGRIIDFAREGRGTMRPLADRASIDALTPISAGRQLGLARRQGKDATLSAEQQAAISHVWTSPDQVILIRGGAGTGKTTMMKTAIAGIDRPVAVLAPSASASRDTLRKEGFRDANTVAAFLGDEQWQQKMKGGVIWIDEAGLLPIKDLDQLSSIALQLNARLILQGDHKQHKSVARHGNMFHVLQEYAGLKLAELKDIKRQKGKYKEAVAAIQNGDIVKGHDLLTEMGSVKYGNNFDRIVDDYLGHRLSGSSVLVVAPTHKTGDAITQSIRQRLKQEGKLAHEEHTFTQLRNLGWSDAQKGDLDAYEGNEVIQFFRNSGPFKAGSKIGVGDLVAEQNRKSARKRGPRSTKPAFDAGQFSVYTPSAIGLSRGDAIRITAGGKTEDGHRIDNGDIYTVEGFTKEGDIALTNGWTISKDFGHIAHAYTTTSFGAQGKTVDHVLVAMTQETAPALNAEQFYVSASRGRKSAAIYTDMQPEELRSLIKRQDKRKSATELMKPKLTKDRKNELARMAREAVVRLLHEQQQFSIPQEIPRHKVRDMDHER